MMQRPQNRWWNKGWFLGLLLVVATLVAYQPAWNGQPVYDDEDHLTPPELRSLTGLAHIWTRLGVVSQYYPLTHSAFWLEHKLWGYAMPGYHLVNILLHASSALLLLRILKRLEVPGAWLAAAIFALHPVEVESVAWISELKNTLSTVCYLGAALACLNFDKTRQGKFYVIALLLFGAGLLSKTVTATLPVALLVVFWWKRGALSWKRDVLPSVPFFLAGIAAGLFTAWVEQKFIGAEGEAFNLTLIQRCLIAGRAFWFYLGKLFWPANLIFIYPRWRVSAAVWWQYLFSAAALVLVAALWTLRRRWRGPLAAVLFFGGTLFPVLGFLNVYPFRYSFVADHYQYLASLGPIVLAAAGISIVLKRLELSGEPRTAKPETRDPNPEGSPKSEVRNKRRPPFGIRFSDLFRISGVRLALCGSLLLTLAVLTWRQSHLYRDVETLWRATLARNPACFVACSNLGNDLLQKGQVDEAIQMCEKALELEPGFAEPHNNLANALLRKGRVDEALRHYQKALEIRPDLAVVQCNIGFILLQRGQVDEAMARFQKAVELRPEFVKAHVNLGNVLLQKGRMDEAMVHFRKALEILPDDAEANSNLGNALLQKGEFDGAVVHLQKALAAQPNDAKSHNDLGNALVQKGRVDEAVAHYQKALALLPDFDLAHYNLGCALLQKRELDQAIVHFQKALAVQPHLAAAHYQIGNVLLEKGRVDEAVVHYQKALEIQPDFAEAHLNLAAALLRKGQAREVLAHCRAALKLQPDNPGILSNLAWLLATWPEASVRNGTEAVELGQRSKQLTGGRDPMALRALAAAFAESGRFAEATATAQRALQLAADSNSAALADALRAELKLYQAGSPFRDGWKSE